MATRRRYSAQEKAKAVQAARNTSIAAVSARLGIPKARLYEWSRAEQSDEEAREKILIETHGADSDLELTPEMEAEAQAILDNRRMEAEIALLQDEYDNLKAKYIELVQRAKSA